MRRFINIEEATFNLKGREEILNKVADKIIYQSTQEEEYDLGKEDFLIKEISKATKPAKWGHQSICNCIVVDNDGVKEKYGFENKVPDLKITLNEKFVYISSDFEECRIGGGFSLREDSDVSKIVTIVKYIIRNGFANLYANKDFAELNSYSNEESANGFYRKNIFLRKKADKIFEHMLKYASEIGLGIEVYNPDHKYGIGLLDKKIVLSNSQRRNCVRKIEDSFIGIEYDDSDLKISFINYHYRIKLSARFSYYEIDEEEIAKQMIEIFKYHVDNGPIESSKGILEEDFDD